MPSQLWSPTPTTSAEDQKQESVYEEMGTLTQEKEKKSPARLFPSYRLAISVMSACGLLLSSMSQSTMGAAMVCMVTDDSINTTTVTFDWDKQTQGWIHSARFLLYFLSQLPTGYLTSYMSGRMMITVGLVAMGTFDILTVPTAHLGWELVILVRCLQGMGNALVTTGVFSVVGKWIPRHESSFVSALQEAGFMGGASLAFLCSSFACETAHVGWPFIFYFTGGLSLVFCAVWYPLTDEEPSVSRWMGQEEKDYLLASKQDEVFHGKIPWGAMLRSGPLYAIILAQIAGDWVTFFSFTVAPSFFTNVLDVSRGHTNLMSGVPFILLIPSSILFGWFLDVLRKKKMLSTVGARRLSEGIFCLVPAVCCIVLALLPSSQAAAAVGVYQVCVLSYMGIGTGWVANLIDIAPLLAGVTLTLSQLMASWTTFVVPVLVEHITVDETKEQWNQVFYISAGIQVVCFAGFCILSSGELQPWAKTEENKPLCAMEQVRSYNSHD